jgi:predicted site-specific integrase-resolvase
MRNITKLEPIAPSIPQKKRVAAYARVSSGKDAMLQSLAAQVSYYSAYIQRRPEWEYVGVYAEAYILLRTISAPSHQPPM